jgi:hypothetical protein
MRKSEVGDTEVGDTEVGDTEKGLKLCSSIIQVHLMIS